MKNLKEIYDLVQNSELKKEDLVDVENLFEKLWNNPNYCTDEDYDDLIEDYEENFDISQDYGIAEDIFVTIKTIETMQFPDRIELKFFASNLDCADCKDYEYTVKITDETKNELAKNNVQKHEKLDECVLKSAVFQAAKAFIINDEIKFLQAEAK